MIQTCGLIGTQELILIFGALLLLFGGKKIPELARGLGKGMKEFKKAVDEEGLAKDLKDVASDIQDFKEDVDKINPKKILKTGEKTVGRKK
ncbi:twin-arginine translocase TatA/TatE family subunit [Candidatus Sulfidibacterium hydrothermale]|uniref:twin-arginine translocase TatA/TatE family subunit n=1 Tax=Candidatus Sulfidibacterium hydrothermale TaxID=2875962 RepID=UPI001F0A815F|nr:twin-arginine translocase TatA/TatE family subunit [Candidatus Sulfidibacterium hydrothermale]UBM62043.1 twin-arginine translocase TatA/TatE family subunit [Candidatus Sulfidibacterium hydrothermale]